MHRFRYDGTRPARSYTPELPSSRIVSIGKSGGEGALGLDRPTVVERAIATIPLPYPVTCTVLALLATGPGYFLAHLIESGGDLDRTATGLLEGALGTPPPPSIPRVLDRLGPVRCGAVVPPPRLDPSTHGGGEASRDRYGEFEGKRYLCAAHDPEPDVGTEPPRSARPARPHARDSPASGGGTPNPDPADLAVRDAGDDPHCRDHLDRGRRRGGTRRGRLFPPAVEPTRHDPKVKAPTLVCGPGIVRCTAQCGVLQEDLDDRSSSSCSSII